ncbi:MAG: hypothetical protein K2F87_04175 [Muribaculaceae bacterium]|nr:hypothetical protein [Muribaculaceae bacterium]
MIRSAWEAWLHPRKAFEELNDLRGEVDSLTGEVKGLRHDRTHLLAGLRDSREVQEDFERLRASMEKEVSELRRVNAEQAQRLQEWETASAEMERVAEQLDKMVGMRERMNQMRRDYEARIEKLERQLWSTRSGGLQYTDPSRVLPDPAESELLEPGESPFAPPTIRMAPERPKITPSKDDTDWLLSLPPD